MQLPSLTNLRLLLRIPGRGITLPGGERPARPLRRYLLLAAYGLVVFGLLLGSRLASDRLATLAGQGLPPETGLKLTVEGQTPLSFPPGFSAERLTLTRIADGRNLLVLDKPRVRMALWQVLLTRLALTVDGTVGGGALHATVGTGAFFNTGRVSTAAEAKGLPLEALPALGALDAGLKGTLSGEVALSVPLDAPLTGSLDADLAVAGLDVVNFIPLLNPPRLPAMDVALELEADDGIARLKTFTAQGNGIDLEGRGQVGIDAATPANSTLDFDATLTIPAEIVIPPLIHPEDYKALKRGREIAIHLSGTPQSPRLDRR